MKKIWKMFLAVSLSLCMALDMPLRLPAFSPAAYGAERPASVQATSLNVRSGPGTGYSIVGKLTYGAGVTVVDEAVAADGSAWYRIRFTGESGGAAEGYVMGVYLKFPSAYSSDANFEQYLTAQGFPESYRHGLRELHARYPQWIFTAVDTGLDWNEVIQNESLVGRNLVSSSSPTSWKSTAPGAYDWTTNTWPGFDGSGWVAASEAIIRYYMDPRNFLNETYIFQFLGQSYDSAIHTREGLAALVKGTFLEGAVPVGSTWTGVSQGTAGNGGAGSGVPAEGNGTGGGVSAGGSGPGADGVAGGGTGSGTPAGGGSTGSGTPAGGGSTGSGTSGGDGVSFQPPGNGGSVQTGYGPGYSQNTPDNVQVGVPPGTNDSKGSGELSVSIHKVERVAATVIRVGPGGEGQPSGTGSGEASGGGQSGGADPGISSGGAAYTGGAVPYVDILMEAGVQSGVNPYVLAAMILQEQGSQGKSESISGASGYYNFFNFEAYASNGMTAVQRGLWYASQPGNYMRPWDSVDKAIIGGACQYGQNYVQAGQNTFYLKKFNVQGSNLYKHQYMTNVEGAAAEGAKMAGAYSEAMRQSPMQFMIPIFRNMPEGSCAKPSSDGSPNNRLSAISVDGFSLSPAFSQDIEYYEVSVNTAVSSVMLRATAVDSTAQISGTGTINLNREVTDVKVIVTAQSGVAKEYTIRIIRSDGAPLSNNTAGSGGGQAQGQGGVQGSSGAGNQGGPGFETAGEQGDKAQASQGGPGGSNVTIVY